MDSGYYAAMSGLVARTQAMDIAATNLANAGTPGYRSEQEYFRSVLLGPEAGNSQLGRTVNNFGVLGGDRLNMSQGALTQTGNPLDLAIEGEGFSKCRLPTARVTPAMAVFTAHRADNWLRQRAMRCCLSRVSRFPFLPAR
jgi:flagellar basal-body rod protein FlgF